MRTDDENNHERKPETDHGNPPADSSGMLPPTDSKDLFAEQIPILNDIVDMHSQNRTSAMKPAGNIKVEGQFPPQSAVTPTRPRYVDLFSHIEMPATETENQEQQVRTEAEKVVDQMVNEYSQEIIRRLRDELGSVLEDLAGNKNDHNPPDGTKQG